jgi:RTX calcium-binding nonapeptide repeat (4 copies)
MKRAILILLAILAAQSAVIAHAAKPVAPVTGGPSYTVVLAGGTEQSMIHIWLTPDGRSYVIDSVAPLQVGGTICENPPGNSNELVCQAPLVAGFEVNAGPGNDSVWISRALTIPVTMRGGPGDDLLTGGSGDDKLIGGDGEDRLSGRAGNDLIFGGPGKDVVRGAAGDDIVRGGPGEDIAVGGSGENDVRQSQRPARPGLNLG